MALGAAAAGWLHPLIAAVAMVVSSLTVLSNSMRLTRFPDDGIARRLDERNEHEGPSGTLSENPGAG